MDHKRAGIDHFLRCLPRIGLQKQPGQAKVFVSCSICCKMFSPRVSAIFPANFDYLDLFVKFCKVQFKSGPLSNVGMPQVELESVPCNQFCTINIVSCCTRCSAGQDPQRTQ